MVVERERRGRADYLRLRAGAGGLRSARATCLLEPATLPSREFTEIFIRSSSPAMHRLSLSLSSGASDMTHPSLY